MTVVIATFDSQADIEEKLTEKFFADLKRELLLAAYHGRGDPVRLMIDNGAATRADKRLVDSFFPQVPNAAVHSSQDR